MTIKPEEILIIGANGQLGTALREQYPQARAVDVNELDITDRQAVESFDWNGVSTIINAAAYTAVDGAETPEGGELARKVNSEAIGHLAQIALDNEITIVHISTDYVFDGTKSPHTEDEPLSPISVYGQTKAAGDKALVEAPKHYLLRTSWVIGEGNNFVRTMIGLAAKDISPKVVSDQMGRLTFTSTLVEAIDHLLTAKATFGTYNVTNEGKPASWADITRAIFKELGRDDLTVTNTTTDEYFAGKPGIAPRPLNSVLDLSKIEATGFKPRDWHDDLKQYVEKEMQK